MDPVIFTASFTNIIIFLFLFYFLIVFELRPAGLEAWRLALAALAAGRLLFFNFWLKRQRSAVPAGILVA